MPKPEAKRYSAEEAAELVHNISVSHSKIDRFDNGSQSESNSEEEVDKVDDYCESEINLVDNEVNKVNNKTPVKSIA